MFLVSLALEPVNLQRRAYNRGMIETLYKTMTPEKGRSECYVLVLTSRPACERKVYVFMEEHGRWDDRLERFLHEVTSISTEHDLNSEEALEVYSKAKKRLAEEGFIHSFFPDYKRKRPLESQMIERESVCA